MSLNSVEPTIQSLLEPSLFISKEQEPLIQNKPSVEDRICYMCSRPSKYKCPCCLRLSCSLPCSKAHKTIYECTGVSDKTTFVPMTQYNINSMMSDFYFLEDVNKSVDDASRFNFNIKTSKKQPFQIKLAAQKGIKLKIMPDIMKRHKINTTYYVKTSKTFQWTVELKFIDCGKIVIVHKVDELNVIADIISKVVDDNSGLYKGQVYIDSKTETNQIINSTKESNEPIQMNPTNESRMQVPLKYIQCDLESTLLGILNGKTIVEFPTLYITKNELK